MFVVDDILFTYIVLPYGTRLLNQGREHLYKWLDKELGWGGRRLVRRIKRANLSDDAALKALGQYVEKHPEKAQTLATAAFATELETASALPAEQSDEQFLKVVRDYFLTPLVEMVQALGRPAILPGFLTGTAWLTAIDVRTVPPGKELEEMFVIPQREEDLPRIMLWKAPARYGTMHSWLPRLWLVKARDEEFARKLGTTPVQLAATLDKLARDVNTTPQRFAEALEKQPFVTGITRHHVVVQHVRMEPDSPPDRDMGQWSDRIEWAKTPAGIKDMRTELARQLGDQQQQVAMWIRALKNQ